MTCAGALDRPGETLDLPFSYIDTLYERDAAQTVDFFRRFGPWLSVEGKSVLEVGSGLGPVCIQAAHEGARRVVGVDIVPKWIDYARDRVRREGLRVADRVELLLTSGDLRELGDERFDVVVSKDAFEHYADPELMVQQFDRSLADDGVLAIRFGPLWKAPTGGHIPFTHLPWAHLIVPERIIMNEKRRLLPKENSQRFEDAIGGLNRMTLERFRSIMDRSNFRAQAFRTNISDRPAMKVMRALSRVLLLEEYFTHNV